MISFRFRLVQVSIVEQIHWTYSNKKLVIN